MNNDLEAWVIFIVISLLTILIFYFAVKTGFGNADKFNNLFKIFGVKTP